MLKIKAPIEFKCNTDVTTVGDSFGEHIRANYGVMGVGLNGDISGRRRNNQSC